MDSVGEWLRDGTYSPSDAIATAVVGGLPMAVSTRNDAAEAIIDSALRHQARDLVPFYATSANGEVLSRCARDVSIRRLFLAASVIHADGMPLVLASRYRCAVPLPQRIATTDLFHDVAQVAMAQGASFYFLGAEPDVVRRATENIRRQYPALALAGFHHGYFPEAEEPEIVREIIKARPTVLWVAMGVPREQEFVVRNLASLRGVGAIKTAGGLFDFLAGAKSRAPRWMQSAGLEWLYRLMLEPRRLFLRYALTNPHAAYLLFTRCR